MVHLREKASVASDGLKDDNCQKCGASSFEWHWRRTLSDLIDVVRKYERT